MTLHEWANKYDYDVDSETWKPYAFTYADCLTNREAAIEVYNLSDYVVTSVAGGTIWLRRRENTNV